LTHNFELLSKYNTWKQEARQTAISIKNCASGHYFCFPRAIRHSTLPPLREIRLEQVRSPLRAQASQVAGNDGGMS